MSTALTSLRLWLPSLLITFAGCAQGSVLVGDDDGGGGSAAAGGSSSGGSQAGGAGNAPSGTGAVTTSGTPSTSGTGATTSSTTGAGSTTSTTTSATTSATTGTGGGPVSCDPLNPGPGCGAGQHCFPNPNGVASCGPAGAGGPYALCGTSAQCAPIYECINDGVDSCCMQWCAGDLDCPAFESCYPLSTPVYVGAVEYGVCWDGLPCVI